MLFYVKHSVFLHSNIYNDGKVCISILHEGQDEFGYEDISWNHELYLLVYKIWHISL